MEGEPSRARVFFYGTFMSPAVLADYGIIAEELVPARVENYELQIRPRVNMVPSHGTSVYGAVVSITHDDLETVYSDLETRFGIKYLPQAVLAETLDGTPSVEPVLCYMTSRMTPGPAAAHYLKELSDCVRSLNFPESYVRHIESFGH